MCRKSHERQAPDVRLETASAAVFDSLIVESDPTDVACSPHLVDSPKGSEVPSRGSDSWYDVGRGK